MLRPLSGLYVPGLVLNRRRGLVSPLDKRRPLACPAKTRTKVLHRTSYTGILELLQFVVLLGGDDNDHARLLEHPDPVIDCDGVVQISGPQLVHVVGMQGVLAVVLRYRDSGLGALVNHGLGLGRTKRQTCVLVGIAPSHLMLDYSKCVNRVDLPLPDTLSQDGDEGGVAFIARVEGHGGQHSGVEVLTPAAGGARC